MTALHSSADAASKSAGDAADLIELIVNIAREIRHAGGGDADIVRLSSAESAVMRYVDRHPGVTAGEVATGTSLQRSNLSTALRALELSGLVERRAEGRSVRVWPTDLAARNLAALRLEWASRVDDALGERAVGIDETLALLGVLESGLVGARSAAARGALSRSARQ